MRAASQEPAAKVPETQPKQELPAGAVTRWPLQGMPAPCKSMLVQARPDSEQLLVEPVTSLQPVQNWHRRGRLSGSID